MKRILLVISFAVLISAAPLGTSAQTTQVPASDRPRVVNAKLETRAVSGPLEKEFKTLVAHAAAPQWIGYAVPEIPGDRTVCCGNYSSGAADCGRCALETSDRGFNMSNHDKQPVALEGSRLISVLFRVEHSRVDKIRVFSMDCELDAGGLTLSWLTGVQPVESVAVLSAYVTHGEQVEHGDSGDRHGDRISHGVLTAIALHADSAADRALENFVAAGQPESLRRQASFWLGSARGKAGLTVLTRMARSDPSLGVRSHVAFVFSVSHEPGAVDEMIRMAREDSSEHVRGQALFWLGHKAGKKALGAIDEAIANDPATGVKKKAVFALSQLPKDEGVPKLIEVARNNRNPVVRKQAMFWLGQSRDPRALAFFEEILTH